MPTPEWAIHSVIAYQEVKATLSTLELKPGRNDKLLLRVLRNILHQPHAFTFTILLKFSATKTGCRICSKVHPIDVLGITMNYVDHSHVPLL